MTALHSQHKTTEKTILKRLTLFIEPPRPDIKQVKDCNQGVLHEDIFSLMC